MATKGSRSGTTNATTLAVKLAADRVRRLGFNGSKPHLQRELPDGTVWLVNFQRMNAGVTGREPGFTVNLNVVTPTMLQEWRERDDWRVKGPLRSGADIGFSTRLGLEAFGHDHWWHPGTDDDAEAAAVEIERLMETAGLAWLDRMSGHA